MRLTMITAALALIFTISAFAAPTTEGFHKRFNIIRDDGGNIIAISDRSIGLDFSILTYVKALKSELQNEQIRSRNRGDYYAEAEQVLFEDFGEKGKYKTRFPEHMIESIREVNKLPIEKIFENPKFKELITKFEDKLKSLMLELRLDLLTKLDDPTYYYKRNVGYQAVQFGLKLAKKYFSQIQFLNTASYVIVQVEKLIRERRIYHQNILMYYFNNFSEAELGMTKDEVDRAMSSIYESRIDWFNIFESRRARNTWQNYGFDKFYTTWRAATSTLRKNNARYDSVGDRLNFAFNDVVFEEKKVIINLFDNESIIQWYPSVAFEYDRPEYIKRKRELLRLVQIGVSFIPIPGWIKDIVDSYVDSTYTKQRLTEGSLYAHFEANGMSDMRKLILKQTMNPFETLE
ncbi:MAG: hypothetical protein KAQ98_04845 [Bacteriovoracaceae bacterium]|nr:hypothetical protein [Bacteriovoracaceae bacterium]